MRRTPSGGRPPGCTSSGSNVPSSPTRARQTVTLRPSSSARAPMCGESARTTSTSSRAGRARSRIRSSGSILPRVRHALLVLRPELGLRRPSTSSRSSAASAAARAYTSPASSSSSIRNARLSRDRPRVELLHRAVDRHARLDVARHERALDRSRAAPARQQRRVDVQPEPLLEELLRDEPPVGDRPRPSARRDRGPARAVSGWSTRIPSRSAARFAGGARASGRGRRGASGRVSSAADLVGRRRAARGRRRRRAPWRRPRSALNARRARAAGAASRAPRGATRHRSGR